MTVRVLLFSDLHGDLEATRRIAGMLRDVDYGFCLGDLSRFGRGLQESIEVLDVGTPLYLLPGNMDPAGEVERACRERPNLHYFHGCSMRLGDHTLAGMGGGVITPFRTPFELSDGEACRLLEGFRGLDRLILLTHCPAHDTALDLALSGHHIGSRPIRQFILEEQPVAAYSGHVHENEGKSDKLGSTVLHAVGRSGLIIEV